MIAGNEINSVTFLKQTTHRLWNRNNPVICTCQYHIPKQRLDHWKHHIAPRRYHLDNLEIHHRNNLVVNKCHQSNLVDFGNSLLVAIKGLELWLLKVMYFNESYHNTTNYYLCNLLKEFLWRYWFMLHELIYGLMLYC